MARLMVEGDNVVVRLGWREQLQARRREVRVPLSLVKDVRIEPDWWRPLRGKHRRGRSSPNRLVGDRVHPLGLDFVAVRAGAPVVVLESWRGAPFARVAVSVPDSEAASTAVGRIARQRARQAKAAEQRPS